MPRRAGLFMPAGLFMLCVQMPTNACVQDDVTSDMGDSKPPPHTAAAPTHTITGPSRDKAQQQMSHYAATSPVQEHTQHASHKGLAAAGAAAAAAPAGAQDAEKPKRAHFGLALLKALSDALDAEEATGVRVDISELCERPDFKAKGKCMLWHVHVHCGSGLADQRVGACHGTKGGRISWHVHVHCENNLLN